MIVKLLQQHKKKCKLYSVFLISPSSALLSYKIKNNGFINFILVKFLLVATRKTVWQTYLKGHLPGKILKYHAFDRQEEKKQG